MIGNGSFANVWREECVAGSPSVRVRAVKDIRKDSASLAENYSRELEAFAKFSHDRVSYPTASYTMPGTHLTAKAEVVCALLRAVVRLVRE